MSTICERCGGQKTVYIKVEPVYSNGFIEARHAAATSSTMKICMCPLITKKHDGKLDKDEYYRVDLEKNAYCPRHQDCMPVVRIECKYSENMVKLTPAQALSLLAWLKQEQDTLEQLAQEAQ